MLSHPRSLPTGFIAPCLPTSAPQPPAGTEWLHEIKHDGFRVIARKDGASVRLYSRPGNDLTDRSPLIVEALARLRPRSCIIDGKAVACGEDGIASFDRIRYRQHDATVFLYAFDLVELNGDDLRCDPLAVRKATLASLLGRAAPGLRFNEHLNEQDGPLVFAHACKLGLEGIVSAAQLSVSFWAITGLDQVEEPRRAGREAGSRGGLATVTNARAPANGRTFAGSMRPWRCRSMLTHRPGFAGGCQHQVFKTYFVENSRLVVQLKTHCETMGRSAMVSRRKGLSNNVRAEILC
jgi:hypothetical protein